MKIIFLKHQEVELEKRKGHLKEAVENTNPYIHSSGFRANLITRTCWALAASTDLHWEGSVGAANSWHRRWACDIQTQRTAR